MSASSEVLVVKVSILGVAEESLGTYEVTVDPDTMSDQDIGVALARGFRRALAPAVIDYGPKIAQVWRDSDRFGDGDR